MERLLEYVPEEFHKTFTAIIEMTDSFCENHLNEDYQQLARDMAIKVCQKGSPVAKGRPLSWASGIIHALGWVNFLQDPNTEPYMSSAELAESLGVSQGTMAAKSKIIRDGLDIIQMDPDWCLPEILERNPLGWMLEVNGLVMDIRTAPREVQEIAYEKGLIPYIPADKEDPEKQAEGEAEIIKFPIKEEQTEPKPSKEKTDDELTLF